MKGRNIAFASLFFIVFLTLPLGMGYYYAKINSDLTTQVVNQAATLTNLTAVALKVKLDHLVAIGSSIASLENFSSAVAGRDWNSASMIARDIQNSATYYDPYIDRVAVFDVDGVQQAAYPELSGGIGSAATSSAWYAAIVGGKSWYVSGTTQRLSVPRIMVINLAFPVSGKNGRDGFLLIQTPVENYAEFGADISLGAYGFVTIVDQNGNIVADPHSSPNGGPAASIATSPTVERALRGEKGVVVATDARSGEQSLVAYSGVDTYGWAVVTQEPYTEAFGTRDRILSAILFAILATFLIDCIASYVVWFLLERRSGPAKPRKKNGGFTLIELLVVIAIIAILAVVVILALNPAELLRQSRDSSRISDLSTLKSAIALYILDASAPNLASSSLGYGACYISATGANATTSSKCSMFVGSYSADVTSTVASYKNNNSTGWLPINFTSITFGAPLGSLPTDPTNNANYYYGYAATSSGGYFFEINAFMESLKYSATTTGVTQNDGGDNSNAYEAGNKPGLNL